MIVARGLSTAKTHRAAPLLRQISRATPLQSKPPSVASVPVFNNLEICQNKHTSTTRAGGLKKMLHQRKTQLWPPSPAPVPFQCRFQVGNAWLELTFFAPIGLFIESKGQSNGVFKSGEKTSGQCGASAQRFASAGRQRIGGGSLFAQSKLG